MAISFGSSPWYGSGLGVVYSQATRDFHVIGIGEKGWDRFEIRLKSGHKAEGWLARASFGISPTIPAGDLLLDLSDAEVRGRGERFDLVDDARSRLSPRYSHTDVTERCE
jgi:hypothetical protein